VVLESGGVSDGPDLEATDPSRRALRDRIERHSRQRRVVGRESQAEVGHQADEPVIGATPKIDDEALVATPLHRDGGSNPVGGR